MVPVIVTVKLPPVDELTLRVEVPDPPVVKLTLVGFTEVVGPEVDTLATSATLPEKPPRLLTVMVEVPD